MMARQQTRSVEQLLTVGQVAELLGTIRALPASTHRRAAHQVRACRSARPDT